MKRFDISKCVYIAYNDTCIITKSTLIFNWQRQAAVPGIKQDWVVNTAKFAPVLGLTPRPPRSAPYKVSIILRIVKHDHNTIGMYLSVSRLRETPHKYYSAYNVSIRTP
jgi:hypothetical protein